MTRILNPEISVLANSLPRGGPFLLSSALQLLGYRKYAEADIHGTPAAFNYLEARKALKGRQTQAGDGMVGISPFAPCYVEKALMHKWLGVLAGDQYIMAHIPWSPALTQALDGLNCRQIAIIRDPRSLLLSLLFDTHPMPRFLIEPFAEISATEQLNFMLSGGELPLLGMTLIAFADMYRSMMAWLDKPDCLVVRFENLVGSKGGGCRDQQACELEKIACFLGMTIDKEIYARLEIIDDPSINTFRLDQMDQWSVEISRDIVDRVLAACEPLANEADYL